MTGWSTAAALCLLLQGAPPESRIVELESDSVSVREEASEALVRRGFQAVPLLRNALEETRSPEVRARLREILRRIEMDRRQRSFRGGAPAGGLAASLRARERPFREGVTLTLEIMNVGDRAVVFTPLRCCRLRLPGGISRCGSDDAEILVQQTFSNRRGTRPSPFHSCRRSGRPPVLLHPGESRTFGVDLGTRRDRVLDAGRYLIRATVFGRERNLKSNPVWITIR